MVASWYWFGGGREWGVGVVVAILLWTAVAAVVVPNS